jgi:hypothetical protein
MSDLDQLRVSLDEALRTVSPGPAPVDAAVRRGKGIRVRRRLTVLAGVAAVVAAGVAGYPALNHGQPSPPAIKPPAHRHAPSVTDIPPGRGASLGAIAEGKIYGAPWQVSTGMPGTPGMPSAARGKQCCAATGSVIGQGGSLTACFKVSGPDAANPVMFGGWYATGSRAEISVGLVRADVRYVTVSLSDGTPLKLIPVVADGTRYVAFVVPDTLAVDSATAYLSNGQNLTAIPFDKQQHLVIFGMWLRPGQASPPRITRTVSIDQSWRVTAYAGPWGTCLTDTSADNLVCVPSTAPLDTRVLLVGTRGARSVFGSAAANVSYLRVTLTHGKPLKVSPVAVGKQKFWALLLPARQALKHWTAYDAAGGKIASGTATSGP